MWVAWMKPKSFTTDGSVGYNGIHADIYSEIIDMEIMSPFWHRNPPRRLELTSPLPVGEYDGAVVAKHQHRPNQECSLGGEYR